MKKVAIIGGGISGLYIANLLRKNSSYEITIYEKNNSLNLERGYGIQLSVNSIKLLNEIDFQNINLDDKFLLIKNTKFSFLKNLKIFPMDEIPKYNNVKKDLNFKISNMNMNIIVKFTKIKGSIPNSSWIDSSKLDSYTLPTFTKKIFSYLEKNQ